MTTESTQLGIMFFIILFMLGIIIRMCHQWGLCIDKNEDLQNENSDLIERNEKLDTYLDETRAVVITQNKIINDLQTENVSLDVALDVVIEQRDEARNK